MFGRYDLTYDEMDENARMDDELKFGHLPTTAHLLTQSRIYELAEYLQCSDEVAKIAANKIVATSNVNRVVDMDWHEISEITEQAQIEFQRLEEAEIA